MPKLRADFEACQGYGNCVAAAPDVFDLDDEGIVALLLDEVPDSERNRLERAVRTCPVSALFMDGS